VTGLTEACAARLCSHTLNAWLVFPFLLWFDRSYLHVAATRRENGLKDCAIRSNGGKSLHEFYCTVVLGIVATAVSLIDLGGLREVSNKSSSIPLWKQYDVVVSLNSENDTKLAKLVKDFDIPTTTLTALSKIKTK